MFIRQHGGHFVAGKAAGGELGAIPFVHVSEDGGVEFLIAQTVQLGAGREFKETHLGLGVALAEFPHGGGDKVVQKGS